MVSVQTDEYGVPFLQSVLQFQQAPRTETYEPLEKILRRLFTGTEKSAAEAMASEHASYGSTRFYLKAWLPTNGANHIKAIGDEAAAAALYYNPRLGTTIVAAYSSESHNGPSYVCAHPGAATGAGGNFRDNGALTGTKPHLSHEARRQCDPRRNPHKDPVAQHTAETTRGIGDYANAVGVPHGTGSMKYHPNFAGNNLVNVMATTFARADMLFHNKVPLTDTPEDYVAIYVGKASDTTGIGGTKFASVAIDMNQTDLNEKAVQDPDPHLEENLFRGLELLMLRASGEGWLDRVSVKDMGAAGLLCSTLEQLHGNVGVILNGNLVPTNAPRTASELLEAETQERFFIYVHKDRAQQVLDIFNKDIGLPFINKGAAAAIIGRCTNTGRYQFVHNGLLEVDLPVEDFAQGPLLYKKVAEPKQVLRAEKHLDIDYAKAIDVLLASPNFKSDEFVHDHYDKNVQSLAIVRRGQGPAVLHTHEFLEGAVGLSSNFDSNAVYGLLDPKLQAEDSLVRGAFNMALVGCSVIGVTNNANYGRTNVPEEMWQFTQGQAGVANACRNWSLAEDYIQEISQDPSVAERFQKDSRRHLTVNSGNCSLNKANANTGTAIPPTTILGLQGWTNTPGRHATWTMDHENSTLYLIGERQAALGGTDLLQELYGPACTDGKLFTINYETAQREVSTIIDAVRGGLVAAGNNIEEGGLANAVAEMFANTNNVSITVDLDSTMGSYEISPLHKLASESHGVVLQVRNSDKERFEKLMAERNVTAYKIGYTNAADKPALAFLHKGQEKELEKDPVTRTYRAKMPELLAA